MTNGASIILIALKGTKLPACSWKAYQSQRPSEEQLRDWFGTKHTSNMAVVFGAVSGNLVCRDFDVQEAYDRWAAAHADLSKRLPTVATARGRHVYFVGNEGKIINLADGELRGAGYCLLPPSRHPSGAVYRWIVPLPEGPLPVVEDARAVGLLGGDDNDSQGMVTPLVPANEFSSSCPARYISDEAADVTETTENDREDREYPENRVQPTKNGSVPSVVSVTLDADIEQAIVSTLPKTPGRRNRLVFEFARALKANPRLVDAPVDSMKPYLREWHRRALPYISTLPFEESWIDFIRAWPKVKFPKGAEPMTMILERVRSAPLPVAAAQYEPLELQFLGGGLPGVAAHGRRQTVLPRVSHRRRGPRAVQQQGRLGPREGVALALSTGPRQDRAGG